MEIKLIRVEYYDKKTNETYYLRDNIDGVNFNSKAEFELYKKKYDGIFRRQLRGIFTYMDLWEDQE